VQERGIVHNRLALMTLEEMDDISSKLEKASSNLLTDFAPLIEEISRRFNMQISPVLPGQFFSGH
jgi:hypothetical protein